MDSTENKPPEDSILLHKNDTNPSNFLAQLIHFLHANEHNHTNIRLFFYIYLRSSPLHVKHSVLFAFHFVVYHSIH